MTMPANCWVSKPERPGIEESGMSQTPRARARGVFLSFAVLAFVGGSVHNSHAQQTDWRVHRQSCIIESIASRADRCIWYRRSRCALSLTIFSGENSRHACHQRPTTVVGALHLHDQFRTVWVKSRR